VLGAGVWRGTAATIWRNVVPTFIYRALRGKALPVEGGGAATRDFIFIDDIVEGLLLCAINGSAGDVYNLASGAETSVADLAGMINELAQNRGGIEPLPSRVWDRSGRRVGSTVKSKRELGFAAEVTLRDGLSRTIDWTRKNFERIEAAIARHASRVP